MALRAACDCPSASVHKRRLSPIPARNSLGATSAGGVRPANLRNHKSSGNAGVERGKFGVVGLREGEKVGIRRPCGSLTPRWPGPGIQVIREKLMRLAQRIDHAFKNGSGLRCGHFARTSLHGHTDESKFWNGGSQDPGAIPLENSGDPMVDPIMVGMIPPSPGDQDVDVEKVFHGNWLNISRTVSWFNGGMSASPLKAGAPVATLTLSSAVPVVCAEERSLRLRYSDMVNFARRACVRMARSSSSVTLNVMVFTGNTVILNWFPFNPRIVSSERSVLNHFSPTQTNCSLVRMDSRPVEIAGEARQAAPILP